MPTEQARTLFISDLHLCDERSELTTAFKRFLQEQAACCDALYILGDFFNFWIGDDHHTHTSDEAAAALNTLAATDCHIFLMHGNRDFLIKQEYLERCGATLLSDPTLLELYDRRYLLMHGDSLCTLDTDYLAFRKMVRDPQWQTGFLSHTLEERLSFAEQARQQSKSMSSNKAQDIMDVSQDEVEKQMLAHRVNTLIHGHTHRPAVHDFSLDGTAGDKQARRFVLGDWDTELWYLEITPEDETLHRLPI